MATPAQNWMAICNGLKDGAATQQQAEEMADAFVQVGWLDIQALGYNPATLTANQKAAWAIKETKRIYREKREQADAEVIAAQAALDAAKDDSRTDASILFPDDQF
jgi:hypothetical protein